MELGVDRYFMAGCLQPRPCVAAVCMSEDLKLAGFNALSVFESRTLMKGPLIRSVVSKYQCFCLMVVSH